MRELSALETRVLGVLVEKERTVPDAYPLSLNALVGGCNQKTSRNPIMNATEVQVLEALESLKRLSMVIESSGGRVMRYAQNVKRVLQVPTESVALLAMLMLRGAQTAAELRSNCERICRFSDVSAAEAFLEELAARSSGALVLELPRQPGSRETRWVHCLCGAPVSATIGTLPRPGLQVDLPEVVAEVSALLSSYEQALLCGDAEESLRLVWQSPKVLLYQPGEAADVPAAAQSAVLRRQVTTFGRDFASTSIEIGSRNQWCMRRESHAWVRLKEGWRIVAVHASKMPPHQDSRLEGSPPDVLQPDGL